MSFAELYKNHAYADLIQEAETQGIGRGVRVERERINGIIEQFIENSDYPEVVSSLQWLQDVIKGENK